jgi:hypothetical protein
MRVAIRRAAHQLLDVPPVLLDPMAIPILGGETASALRADPGQFEKGRLISPAGVTVSQWVAWVI